RNDEKNLRAEALGDRGAQVAAPIVLLPDGGFLAILAQCRQRLRRQESIDDDDALREVLVLDHGVVVFTQRRSGKRRLGEVKRPGQRDLQRLGIRPGGCERRIGAGTLGTVTRQQSERFRSGGIELSAPRKQVELLEVMPYPSFRNRPRQLAQRLAAFL